LWIRAGRTVAARGRTAVAPVSSALFRVGRFVMPDDPNGSDSLRPFPAAPPVFPPGPRPRSFPAVQPLSRD